VAVLDLDLSQPELSPPGMMTLSVVRSPLFAPMSSSSQRDTFVEGRYVGQVTGRDDPGRYVAAIRGLLGAYHSLEEEGSGFDCQY